MKALGYGLACLVVLTATGCDGSGGGSGDAGGAGGAVRTNPAAACLAAQESLSAKEFAGTSSAVEAFARAAASCKASASQLRAAALLMQENGATILREGD